MVAGEESQHKKRIPHVDPYDFNILPIAAIYGGNAAGKTNLFKALRFARDLIVNGTQPDNLIGVETFLLDDGAIRAPTCFKFELLINEEIYEFCFTLTRQKILEEKLVKISNQEEITLFHRLNGKPNFDKLLQEDQFLNFAFQGTRDNQLFLTNAISQKVENFKPVFDWFRDNLILINPKTKFDFFSISLEEKDIFFTLINNILPNLDTGISRLGEEEVSFENLPFNEEIKAQLQEKVKEGRAIQVDSPFLDDRFIVMRKENKLIAKKLVTYHAKMDGTEAKFEMGQNSDGCRRLIDLLPAFLGLSNPHLKKVYVIDELDRSLHTLLTRQLLEAYLAICSPESRSQLIFTTQDVLLMEQQLLRTDEMLVIERNAQGISTLTSFGEYEEAKYDKNIRSSYLQGRLGGIPRISLNEFYNQQENTR
jgi:hypothetical protein